MTGRPEGPTGEQLKRIHDENQKDAVRGFSPIGLDTFSGTDTKVYAVLYGVPITIDRDLPEDERNKELKALSDITFPEHLQSTKALPFQGQEFFAPQLLIKRIADAQTFTVSTFREKPTVRAIGNISARGHARGSRTAAGTIIFTDFFYPNIYDFLIPSDGDYNKNKYTLLDQIPPFDIILYRVNESGLASFQMVFGLEFVTTGKVISVHDLFTEKTVSYKALDFTEEIPSNSKIIQNGLSSAAFKASNAGKTDRKTGINTIAKFRDTQWASRNRRDI